MTYTLNDLKGLVESMSGAEKRHFSMLSNVYAKPTEQYFYLQLFQALTKSKTELPDFPEQVSSAVLTTAKRRLFKNIMKSLRVFHQEASIKILIQNYLSEIEISYNHNLPKQSLYILKMAYQPAVDNEQFDLLLQVLEWESKLNIMLDTPTRSMESIAAEELEVLRKLTQIMHLKNIYNKSKEIKKHYGYSKGNINLDEETIHAVNMIRYEECASQKAKFYFNFIHTLYFWMVDNHFEAYKYSKEIIKPEMQVVGANDYIYGVLEHVAACASIGEFESAFTTLRTTKEYMNGLGLYQSHILNIRFIYYEINLHLIIYNYMGALALLHQAIKKAEESIIVYEDKFSLEMKQVVLGNLMNAYLGIGDFKTMDRLWEKIFAMKSEKIRNDINGDLYFFRLFSILQNEIYEVLPSAALSAYRYYNQSPEFRKHFHLELKITAILLKGHHLENQELKHETLNKIKKIFNDYIGQLQNGYQFQEHYSRYVIWISSIMNKQPFHEVAAEWYQHFSKV